MVIIDNYGMQILRQSQAHAPCLLVISMAMAMRQYGIERIDLCIVLSTSIQATGRRNRSSICSVFPQRPPGYHTKNQKTQ